MFFDFFTLCFIFETLFHCTIDQMQLPDHWLNSAQLWGYLAFLLGVSSFLQRDDRRFKILMTAECIAYAAHFGLLGQPTAAASSLVSMSRSLLALYTRSMVVAWGIVAINLALGWNLATIWWNWLPLAASTIGTLALFKWSGIRMRLAMLLGTLLWLVNNVLSGSIGGTILELVVAMTNLYTIFRLYAERPAHKVKA